VKLPRYLRLLPSVVIIGGALFVAKTSDLVHAAYAEASEKVATLTHDPVSSNPDYAGGEDDQVSSASEVNVLGAMTKRSRELDAREKNLNTQANMIAAAESRVDAKITQLKQLQAQIAALLVQRDDAQKAQIASLVKTYSTMKPVDAARIFNTLPDDVLVPVAEQMKSDVLALVLSKMNSDTAQKLTVKLASKLTLPVTADAVMPAPAQPVQTVADPVAPAAQPAAATAPAPRKRRAKPVQQASAAPVSAPVAAPAAATPAPAPATTPAPAAAAPTAAPEKSAEPKT
jgi:flagellar motility protein MotE (MotC chaperone)